MEFVAVQKGLIAYASETGTSEDAAEKICRDFGDVGYMFDCLNCDEIGSEPAPVSFLRNYCTIVFFVSTTGNAQRKVAQFLFDLV